MASGKKQVTMATIAEEAGLGRTTVGYVLNGKAAERGIPEQTAQRVFEIAERLDYVPNEAARDLRTQRSGLIGVLFQSLGAEWPVRVIQGLQDVLFQTEDYHPLITAHGHDPALEEREIQFLLRRRVEAIICSATAMSDTFRTILKRRIPLVFIGHAMPEMPEASSVLFDDRKAIKAGVRRLVEQGRRRIAYLGWDFPEGYFQNRHDGFREALEESGLECREKWFEIVLHGESPEAAVRRMFSGSGQRPDAVFSGLWRMALGALETIEDLGLRLPEDVALITLEDHLACRLKRIGISTVHQPIEEIGRQAARTALDLIASPHSGAIRRLIYDCEVIDRRTTIGQGR
jgi:LacI family transcriptional regulator